MVRNYVRRDVDICTMHILTNKLPELESKLVVHSSIKLHIHTTLLLLEKDMPDSLHQHKCTMVLIAKLKSDNGCRHCYNCLIGTRSAATCRTVYSWSYCIHVPCLDDSLAYAVYINICVYWPWLLAPSCLVGHSCSPWFPTWVTCWPECKWYLKFFWDL